MSHAVEALADCIDLVMPDGRGRRAIDIECEVVREITPEDLPMLATSVVTPRQEIARVSAQHHRIAQLMAQGRNGLEISLLTGYSPAYLSNIKNDPCFAELLAGYSAQKEAMFVDVLERMKALGLSSLEELQRRYDEEPDKWTKRELMELAELMLVKATASGKSSSAGPGTGGVNINVKFVSAAIDVRPDPIEIEGEVVR